MEYLNILTERYVTDAMLRIFHKKSKNILERKLWLSVMKAQKILGVDIPSEDIEAYENALEDLDWDFMRKRELEIRHDIKVKIEAFIRAARGYRPEVGQHPHKRMTARGLTDNVEQIQIRDAGKLIFGRFVSVIRHMNDKAQEYKGLAFTARTHHQPAQITLLGKRFAMWGEELAMHLDDFEHFLDKYPWRGFKGPVGTMSDQIDLLGGLDNALALEKMVAEEFGFKNILNSPGQIYPRSLDYKFVTNLVAMSAACENFSNSMRLMSGYELVTEGFKDGQVGSTAMPHKMNTRTNERIWSAAEMTKMFADGASRISGSQWEEGDVSCSMMRRFILPNVCFAADGLCEFTLTVHNEMGTYPAMIDMELQRYLPFLASTAILGLAMEHGMGREDAHEIIKEYSVKEALAMRDGKRQKVLEKLAEDSEFQKHGIAYKELVSAVQGAKSNLQGAEHQIKVFNTRIKGYTDRYPEEAAYEPEEIL
ncbi:MAG: adenylosuccinate lyase [Nanoarchaeota archaeon]|nr:adenylosuccinate lyase [Nanoarchaeota archaeon]